MEFAIVPILLCKMSFMLGCRCMAIDDDADVGGGANLSFATGPEEEFSLVPEGS